MKKRIDRLNGIIALGLCLMLAASIIMTAASANAAEEAATGKCASGAYAEGYYTVEDAPEGEYGGVRYNAGSDKTPFATLTKSAKYNEGSFNEFDITITAEGYKIDPPPKPVFTVLVLDMSSSMDYNMAGQKAGGNERSRLSLLKEAVSSFMANYFANEYTDNWLSVIAYSQSYSVLLDWTNKNASLTYPSVQSYTNIEAGICGAIKKLDEAIKAGRPGAYGPVMADACEYAVVVMSDGGANTHTGNSTSAANSWTWEKALSYNGSNLKASTKETETALRAQSAVNAAGALANGPGGAYPNIKPKVFSVLYGDVGASDGGSGLSGEKISATMKSIGKNGFFKSGADGEVAKLIFSNIQQMIASPSIEAGAVISDTVPGDFIIKSVEGRAGSGSSVAVTPVRNSDGDYDISWEISSPIGAGNTATLTITAEVPQFCLVDRYDIVHSGCESAYMNNASDNPNHNGHYVRTVSPNGKKAALTYTNVTNQSGKAWRIEVASPIVHAPANGPELDIVNALALNESKLTDGGYAVFEVTVSNASGSNRAYGLTLDAACITGTEDVALKYIGAKDDMGHADPRTHDFELGAGETKIFYFEVALSNDMTEAFTADYERLKQAQLQLEETVAELSDRLNIKAKALADGYGSGFIYPDMDDASLSALIAALEYWIANPETAPPEPPIDETDEASEADETDEVDEADEADESDEADASEETEIAEQEADEAEQEAQDLPDADADSDDISEPPAEDDVTVDVLSFYIPLADNRLWEQDEAEPQTDTDSGQDGDDTPETGNDTDDIGTDDIGGAGNTETIEPTDPYAAQREEMRLLIEVYLAALKALQTAEDEFSSFKEDPNYPDVEYMTTVMLNKGENMLGQATETVNVPPAYGTVKLEKHVSLDGSSWQESVTLPVSGGTAYYRVVISNYSTQAAEVDFSDPMYLLGERQKIALAPRGEQGADMAVEYAVNLEGTPGSYPNTASIIFEDGSVQEDSARVIVPAVSAPKPEKAPEESNEITPEPAPEPEESTEITPEPAPVPEESNEITPEPNEETTPSATPSTTPSSTPENGGGDLAQITPSMPSEPSAENDSGQNANPQEGAEPTSEADEEASEADEVASETDEGAEADEEASEPNEEAEADEATSEAGEETDIVMLSAPITATFFALPMEEIPEGITPASESSTFVQRENSATIIELDNAGTPLGRWYKDDGGIWIFDEDIPLDELPTTGEFSFPVMLFIAGAMMASGGAFSKRAYRKKRRV